MLEKNKKFTHYLRNKIFLKEGQSECITSTHTGLSVLRFIWLSLKEVRGLFLLYAISSIVVVVVDFSITPVFSKILINSVEKYSGLRSEIWYVIKWPFLTMLGLWALNELQARIAGWVYASKIEPTLDAKLKMSYVERVTKNSYEHFLSEDVGSITSKLYSILYISKYFIKLVARHFIPNVFSCLILGVSFVFIHWKLACVILLHFLLTTFTMSFTIKKALILSGKVMQAHSKTMSAITDIILNISSVMLFNRKKYEMKRLLAIQNRESHRIQVNLRQAEWMKIIFSIYGILTIGVLYTYLEVQLYSAGIIQLSDIIYGFTANGAYLTLVYFILQDVVDMIADYGKLQQALDEMSNGKVVLDVSAGGNKLVVTNGKIEFRKITFGYTQEDIFEEENLIIQPKEKVGLVGKSGSGKTTFINLLLKNLELDDGKILIDGQDIRLVSDAELKNNIAVISQDTMLFNRSVLDNIKYGKEEASLDEVMFAAKLANAHDFITELDHGYNTLVGERGSNLSGGQRQRIVIARAILKDAPILILDEATSALDSENEHIIQESLNALMSNKTVIVIAHRLSTLRKMDRIIVLENGEIVEEGNHDLLIAKQNGVYAAMWNKQIDFMLNE